jgi:hypothetical protein
MTDITDAVPRLREMNDALEEIDRLREAIRRLAEQDATLSVQGGNVTVTMDATLTDAERQAIARAVDIFEVHPRLADEGKAATLRGLLGRTKDGGKYN